MRAVVCCLVLSACGFSVPGQGAPAGDGARPIDAPAGVGGDGPGPVVVDAPTIDAALDAPSCPSGFVAIPGAGASKYKAYDKQDQLTALTTCSNQNTHLLHLDSNAEATALEAYIDQQITGGGDTHLYRIVGSRDLLIRSIFHDLDFSIMTFLPWGQNEPTDGFGVDCIVLKNEGNAGVIGADQCSTKHEFACECD